MPPSGIRFRRIEQLGQGGSGSVWLVEDTAEPGRRLALKELAVSVRDAAELRREFALLATLRHPNLVEVHGFDVDKDSQRPWFTLEHVDGPDIVAALQDDRLGSLVPLTVEALRALSFLHDFGLVHRDLKPANMLVRKEPRLNARLVLLDFGLAVVRQDGQPSNLAGTLPYMAPELLRGQPPGRRTDLYGLGAVLFEALWGRPPRRMDAAERSAFLSAPAESAIELPPAPADSPPGFTDWLKQLLSSDPSDRPASAAEALARLNRAIGADHPLDVPETRAARLRSGPPPGREGAIDEIWSALSQPGPRLVWLTGAAGLGKTRLLRWIEAEAVRRGWVVRREPVRAVQADGPSRVVDAALSDLREQRAQSPCLVLFDEVESAPVAVMGFLRRLVQEVNAAPLQAIAALRVDEVSHPGLRRLLDDSELVETVSRVDLLPLDEAAVERVVARALGEQQASVPQVRGLWTASEGNPLLLEGMLTETPRGTAHAGAGAPTLQRSIEKRIGVLSREARDWLLALSIAGPDAPEDLLIEVCGLATHEAREAARSCLEIGLARQTGERYSSASRLVSEFVRTRCEAERLRGLFERTARWVENHPTHRDWSRLSDLWARAGEIDASLRCASSAVAQLTRDREHAAAASVLRSALLLLPRRDPRRQALRREHVAALHESGNQLAAARGLATLVRHEPDRGERGALRALQALALARARRTRLARILAEEAFQEGSSIGAPRAQVLGRYAQGIACGVEGRFADAIELLAPAVDHLAEIGEHRLRAEALMALGYAESGLRQTGAAREHLNAALELARKEDAPRTEAQARLALAAIELHGFNLEKALKAYATAREFARDHGCLREHVVALNNESWALLECGRFDAALRLAREAEPAASFLGSDSGFLQSRMHRAEALVQVGRPSEAASLLEAVLERARPGFEPAQLEYARLTLADALQETVDPPEARIAELIASARANVGWGFKLALGAFLLELERRARPGCNAPFDEEWERFAEFRDSSSAELDAWALIRAQMARGQHSLRKGDAATAQQAVQAAVDLADEKALPGLAARAYSLLGEVHEHAGRKAAARDAFAQGRERLDEAAARIEDEELRQDFLARPVHARLRQAAATERGGGDERLLALYHMVHALNSEDDPELLLDTLLDSALQVVSAERGLVLLRDEGRGGEFRVRAARNLEKQTIADAAEFSLGVVRQAGGGQAVLSIDAGSDARLSEFHSVSAFGIRSVICVPLRLRGQSIGAVYVDNRRQGALFDAQDLRFLEAFADHAALAVDNARTRRRLEYENRRLQIAAEARVEYAGMIGRSVPMQRVFDLVERVAETSLPVLIHGESGTGKELVARALHFQGPRKRKPFLSENCAAIPETLLESELFGHVRGAFTGADRDRQGLFEQADGGTLFLDEVGDMSAAMQARLLRVLQEGELRPVGGSRTIPVDVRIVAATHRDLAAEVVAGRFREDLLYRLQVLMIELPPLRERLGDVPLLVERFLARIGEARGRSAPSVRPAVLERLERHAWPGNVRQLESTLQRLALLAGDGPVTLDLVESDRGLSAMLIGDTAQAAPVYSLAENEREQIRAALASAAGNRVRAARLLGISRATIFRKIKEYGLS